MVQPGDSTPDLQVTGLNLPGGRGIIDAAGQPVRLISQDLAIKIDTSTSSAASCQQVMGLYGALTGGPAEVPSHRVGYAGPGLNTGNAGSTRRHAGAGRPRSDRASSDSQERLPARPMGADRQLVHQRHVSEDIGGAAPAIRTGSATGRATAGATGCPGPERTGGAGGTGGPVRAGSGRVRYEPSPGRADGPAMGGRALTRTETISSKIAVSAGLCDTSNGTGGSILIPAAMGDAACPPPSKVLQGVTSDPHTVATALAGITNAVSHHDLSNLKTYRATVPSV